MTIVVGYLATPEGEAALAAGVAEARLRDARVVVVRSRRARQEEHADIDVELDGLRDRLDEADVAYEVRQPGRGKDVAADLVDTAVETVADLIVIGLRRRSPVGKLILGSNAQRILLDAPCPVLAVKSPAAGDDAPF
ncbi:universal stress protein [Georgenia sp. 311]|uniref:Universal stress protein n=1 Tax=Georgenia wutianyii TaxID=2585135 RepID=A0ABX5VLT3_9MICO|nr:MULTISPECIES: universal stress protein [Georgenia]QDB79452.1 universal stress protein [Georgenia wutianyii]TNC19497.1 universal stress protein [Georgenia sp. 311]